MAQSTFQRYELKYLMTTGQQQAILAAMEPHMEPDQYSHSSIRNLYLDTPDFRVTFDRDIRYRCQQLTLAHDPWGTSLLPQGWVLMEVKAAGAIPLWMVRALSAQGVFQTSFSKYGTAYRDLLAAGKGGVKYA